MRFAPRAMFAMSGLALIGLAAAAPAQADWVPPFKGNDTGGIIAYSLYQQGADIKAMAVDHCARYDKVVKLTGVDAQYGGYISFACVWVPPGSASRPLRAAY
ncbi:MAG: hypothetical protein BGO65_12725 [Afipia sp. 64-13]|nr:MAG: hypothetical protein BGO65_12725 [Afipia sp. 64-13]